MTGFGTAVGAAGGGRLRFEVRTVNHRHLSVQFKVPNEVAGLEPDLRERLRAHFDRGHVTVTARWIEEPAQAAGVTVDLERARTLVGRLREVGRALGLPGDVDVATLARLPDVVRVAHQETAIEAAAVGAILDGAAGACVAMRESEGARLAADLDLRLDALMALQRRVAERAPARVTAERDRLAAAVRELAGGIALDAHRLAQEVAVLADRLDITEELVRFAAHLEACRSALGDGGTPVGRRLGFLFQELAREANTIGAKANDAVIADAVIGMKSELEKLREQIENLE